MKITRTSQITVERERTVSIKIKDASLESFCAGCERVVRFVAADEAARERKVTERESSGWSMPEKFITPKPSEVNCSFASNLSGGTRRRFEIVTISSPFRQDLRAPKVLFWLHVERGIAER